MQPVEISRILFNQFITSLAFKGDPALHTSPGPSAVSVPKQARMGWNRMKSEQQNAAKASVTWSLRRCHRNCSSKEKCWMWEVKFIQFILRHGNKILSDNLIGFGTSDTFDIPLYKEHWHVLQNLKTCLWSLCLILSRGQLLLRSITSSSCLYLNFAFALFIHVLHRQGKARKAQAGLDRADSTGP